MGVNELETRREVTLLGGGLSAQRPMGVNELETLVGCSRNTIIKVLNAYGR